MMGKREDDELEGCKPQWLVDAIRDRRAKERLAGGLSVLLSSELLMLEWPNYQHYKARRPRRVGMCGRRYEDLKRRIFIRDGWTCAICGTWTRDWRVFADGTRRVLYCCPPPHVGLLHPNTATLGHRIPHTKGGTLAEENLQCECWRCNRLKGNRVLAEDLIRRDMEGGALEPYTGRIDYGLAPWTVDSDGYKVWAEPITVGELWALTRGAA
jgi:5-methylcytosine-specific restriction endonuclease McrA